jgi:hypothetical protein
MSPIDSPTAASHTQGKSRDSLLGSINETALLFNAVRELSVDRLSVLHKGEKRKTFVK